MLKHSRVFSQQILMKNGFISNLNNFIVNAQARNKAMAACQVLRAMIDPESVADFVRSQGVFLGL